MFGGHLHVHTDYSVLDGLARIEELIIKAKSLGQKYIAITDHGESAGLFEAEAMAKKHDFKVIFGQEFYFENNNDKRKLGHLNIFVKNEEGLRNMFLLQRLASDNKYYRPRLNLEMLKQHSNGLICSTACIANIGNQLLLQGQFEDAVGHFKALEAIFKEDFYLEIQSSTIPEVIKCNKLLIESVLPLMMNKKMILTNDVHYVEKSDYEIHDILLCIQQQKKVYDEKRWRFDTNDFWLKDQKEMEKELTYVPKNILELCYHCGDELNSKCKQVELERGKFIYKWSDTEDEDLRKLVINKYNTRLKERNETSPSFQKDCEKELKVIAEEGYSGYHLVVQDYINEAKANGILVGDGRGSGAGCKVAYTIGITEINPDKYGLLFERFLSHGREPDYDTDFSDIDFVYHYLQQRYGYNNVARVGALTRFTCKAATRKVMSVFGMGMKEQNYISSLMPKKLSFTLQEAIDSSDELKTWYEKHKEIYNTIKKIEGMLSHYSTHAGGVLIYSGLDKLLPFTTDSKDKDKYIVSFDKEQLEELGHVKYDILGLDSLSVIRNAQDNIKAIHGKEINWNEVDFNDEKVYKTIEEKGCFGLFQLSEQGTKIAEQRPKSFEDLIAINALIRPGAGDWKEYLLRRSNPLEHKTIISDLDYMKETHGIIVYQEQYLLLALTYANWDIAFSDKNIRKNKNITKDVELKEKFINDSIVNGHKKEDAEYVWSEIVKIVGAGYGFNKSHSTSYARLSFQTAYMKAYYPKEFYAAHLSAHYKKDTEVRLAVSYAKKEGISILPPNINTSGEKFIPTEEGIVYNLQSIAEVGGSAMWNIKEMRPIKDFDDFMKRRIPKFIKKNTIENLIKAGAFDYTGEKRYDLLVKFNAEEYSIEEPLHVYEKASYGFYVNHSPFNSEKTFYLDDIPNKKNFETLVEIKEIAVVTDKRGNKMAFAMASNDKIAAKLVIFSSVWQKVNIEEGKFYRILGRKEGSSIILEHARGI